MPDEVPDADGAVVAAVLLEVAELVEVGAGLFVGVWAIVTVAVGRVEEVDVDVGPDDAPGLVEAGALLGWCTVPPPSDVPDPFDPETVEEIGWPDTSSKPVMAAIATAKNAAAESASRFGCSQGDRRAAAVTMGTATVCVPDATTTPDPPATAPEAATVDGAASPNR
jgi:hypothetical protein